MPIEHSKRQGSTVLGIDPGYDRCGFALIDRTHRGKEVLIQSECFTTSAKDPFEQRLVQIGERLQQLIATTAPDTIALERLYFTTNQKTAMHVAEVRGMLLFLATTHNVPVVEYGPNEIKVAIAGDGRASKSQVMAMVPRLISVPHEVRYDDEYDAIAVALTASAVLPSVPERGGV